jgi:DNA-binding response OmpR family regulator
MTRILLADDSPHAQRMGEQILTEEGFEVVTVSDGDSALLRLEDVDPDLVIADAVMPHRTGYEICQYVKISPRHRHARVLISGGVKDPVDEAEARRVKADGIVQKPFEASVLLELVKPLVESAGKERGPSRPRQTGSGKRPVAQAPMVTLVDPERVRAAVTVALDAAMQNLIEEITDKVLISLSTR